MARSREFNKEDVLQQAIHLFSVHGYEGTSIRDVIQATGVSSSSLYEVFGDKRGIFLAALERSCEFERTRISQMAASTTPRHFIEQLFGSLEEVTDPHSQIERSLALTTMVEFGTRDSQITPILVAHYFGVADIIAHMLAQAQAAGVVTTPSSPLDLAHTILSTLQGLATIKGVQPSFAHTAPITQQILKLLKL